MDGAYGGLLAAGNSLSLDLGAACEYLYFVKNHWMVNFKVTLTLKFCHVRCTSRKFLLKIDYK